MRIENHDYSLLMGSDVERDGMFLELNAGDEPSGAPLAEWFYADADATLSLTVYAAGIPDSVLDWFRVEAARRLPPKPRAV